MNTTLLEEIKKEKKFETGEIFFTEKINNLFFKDDMFAMSLCFVIGKYIQMDWGNITEEEKKENNKNISNEKPLFGLYKTLHGTIRIETNGNKTITYVLFENEK